LAGGFFVSAKRQRHRAANGAKMINPTTAVRSAEADATLAEKAMLRPVE
jgi:hypothetical protein